MTTGPGATPKRDPAVSAMSEMGASSVPLAARNLMMPFVRFS